MAGSPVLIPNASMKRRMIGIVSAFTLLGFATVIVRLFFLQVIDTEDYQQKAISQQLKVTPISSQRGTIYSSNMKVLAKSASVCTVALQPPQIGKNEELREKIATFLAEVLELDKQEILTKSREKVGYVRIKRKVEKPEEDKIREFIKETGTSAIILEEDSKRYYPYGNMASTVLGFTGADNQGLTGLEFYYDKVLSGTAGRVVSAKNAWGTDMPFKYEMVYEAKNGNDIVLTIDEGVQYFLDKWVQAAVKEHNVAARAAGVVINVKTMEILWMTTKGDFDLNNPFEIADLGAKQKLEELKLTATEEEYKKELNRQQQLQWRNKVISDPYEPGSIFKIITGASALEEGVVKPSDSFFCTGSVEVGGRTIHCHKAGGHGAEDFIMGMANSCNPVFMAVGSRLGAANYFKYFKAFGFTEKTGIDLPGEGGGDPVLYHPQRELERPVELAVSSFGQTFKVTPLQLAMAVSASINGGNLVQPRLVKQIIDENGNVIQNNATQNKRQVLSAETSKLVAEILEKVVTDGGGKNAYISGYRVGGKSGTSEKIDKKNEAGEINLRISSFMSFAPVEDPEVLVLILLDEPNSYSQFGSVITAPVVAGVMADTLSYLGIEPHYTEEEMSRMDISTPSVVNKRVSDAQNTLNQKALKSRVIGEGNLVITQVPESGQPIPRGGTVLLYTEAENGSVIVTVPNVVGMTAAQANKAIAGVGLNIKIEGSALEHSKTIAFSQSIEPGEKVSEGTVITIQFRNTEAFDR